MCAHAEYVTFGSTEGIGCVPMQKNSRHWACAHAECISFGKIEGIGCLHEHKTRTAASSDRWGPSRTARAVRPQTEREQGGEGVCALRDRALHLLRYCAALAGTAGSHSSRGGTWHMTPCHHDTCKATGANSTRLGAKQI